MTGDKRTGEAMEISDWRRIIDGIDEQLVRLLNERAKAAQEIGRIKSRSTLPIYEPDRERIVLAHVAQQNQGPLPAAELHRIFERIMDVMRKMQLVDSQASGMTAKQGDVS